VFRADQVVPRSSIWAFAPGASASRVTATSPTSVSSARVTSGQRPAGAQRRKTNETSATARRSPTCAHCGSSMPTAKGRDPEEDQEEVGRDHEEFGREQHGAHDDPPPSRGRATDRRRPWRPLRGRPPPVGVD
jgi:hypothetical protein